MYITDNVKKFPYDWATQSILSVLRNEVYLGHIICNRHQTSSFKSKKLKVNPKSEWIINKNMHEPIIDENTLKGSNYLCKARKRHIEYLMRISLKVKSDATNVAKHYHYQ